MDGLRTEVEAVPVCLVLCLRLATSSFLCITFW